MNQWIYGIIIGIVIGIILGFFLCLYTGQPVSEGFQTTANGSIPEMDPSTSCATIEALNKAFLTRIQNNQAFTSQSGTSADIASRKDTLNKLIEQHQKSFQQQKANLGCP